MKYMLSFQCDTLEEAQHILRSVGKEPLACSRTFIDSKELLNRTLQQVRGEQNAGGSEGSEAPTPSQPESVVPPKPPAPRKNISPGTSAITKIGLGTKAALLEELSHGIQPHAKFIEHLKLLWSRGEVKFDGKEFYT